MLLSFAISNLSIAQKCGTPIGGLHDMAEHIYHLKQQPELWQHVGERRNVVRWVPVTIFLVADNSGAGRITEVNALALMCKVNEYYASQNVDIQFWLKRFKYIDKTVLFNTPNSSGGGFQMTLNKVNDSANLFFVNDIPDEGGAGDILAYYQPGDDWVVVQKAQVNGSSANTLAHEMGHFFSLPHTFNGWECGDFVGNGCAPATSSCGDVTTEKADGSNCSTAGDGFCDTPADYGFLEGDCSYTGGAKDQMCQPINPDETNLMGYFDCTDYTMSAEQITAMNIDLSSNDRNYLNNQPAPTLSVVSAAPTALTPANVTIAYGDNFFDWADVENASSYVFEIARNSSFDIERKSFLTTQSQILLTDYTVANKKYYWRVIAYNASSFCAPPSATTSFNTNSTVGADDISNELGWDVFPNPTTTGTGFGVTMQANKLVDANISLITLTGQLLQTQKAQFSGSNVVQVPTLNLPLGVYILQVQSAEGRFAQKVVIAE